MAEITHHGDGTISVSFAPDINDQVKAQHLFDILLGRPITPTCKKCGGTLQNDGPKLGWCICETKE